MVSRTPRADGGTEVLLKDFHFLTKNDPVDISSRHVVRALEQSKQEGLALAVRARWIALAITAVLLVATIQAWDVIYYHFILAGLALIGWFQLRWGKVGRSGWELSLVFLDILLVVFGMLYPNPFFEQDWPTAAQYQFENFKYFYIFLAAMTLGYSWRTVIAYGTWTVGLWLIGMLLILLLGTTDLEMSLRLRDVVEGDARLWELIDPNNVRIAARIEETIVFLIVAAILGVNSFRMNRLVLKQASTTRERTNLARHFPPNMVDQLAGSDEPFAEVRAQDVVVMFVDIVGFTRLAEKSSPEAVVGMLRDFHRLVEEAVFDYGGTLDKYLGDGVMVTFGTPKPGTQDATDGLSCADALINKMSHWNDERETRGEAFIKLSIGMHFGSVILGDIGTERRLEYATLGDTVNVASRLEEMTRSLNCQSIVSAALIEAVKRETADWEALIKPHYKKKGLQQLRGRDARIGVWARK